MGCWISNIELTSPGLGTDLCSLQSFEPLLTNPLANLPTNLSLADEELPQFYTVVYILPGTIALHFMEEWSYNSSQVFQR